MAEKPVKFVVKDQPNENCVVVVSEYRQRPSLIYRECYFGKERVLDGQPETYIVLRGNADEPEVRSLSKEDAGRLAHSRALSFAERMASKHRCDLEDLSSFSKKSLA